ncbi:hypothetical protein [Pantoea phytobeneficialis]|uniref:Uncharacterized protein n=1 Tax=Pantoea phytobeneficialis TaxID=2052056 RepID=A0AAP9HAL8_9GAMM|nr:hypothetical protein [Pantoea phytobeneficialis]MDO6406525.1 hypothetical protein [Pantoea phytobeneficialis]QGR09622.1 hypothetical protein CTZ24_24460 [Pantoea phytobeneficialis]
MMKSWFDRLLGKNTEMTFPVVWDAQQPSIYACLAESYAQAEPLPADARVLANQPMSDSDEICWAPGALEGTMIYHFGVGNDGPDATEILSALHQVQKKPDTKAIHALYQLINQGSPVHYIDELLSAIPQSQNLRAEALCKLVVWLATASPDRNVVKFAMALMAYFPQQRTVEILQVLARHDEFTLYAVVALRAMLEPEEYAPVWYGMAQRVTGWGRIHLMERMPEQMDDELRRWLLREGFSNSVMNEYTAVNCAVRGGLLAALETEHDDALLMGAAEMLYAMLMGGPVPGISVYDDAPLSCLRYLEKVLACKPSHPLHFLTARHIGTWVESETSLDPATAQHLAEKSKQVQAMSLWDDLIPQILASGEGYVYYLAIQVSRERKQDPWPSLFERQCKDSAEDNWYQLMQTEDAAQAQQVCTLAQAQFDLPAIASGPALSSGVGPNWKMHSKLDAVVQELKRFPSMGWPLLEAALQSPVIRNRQMALNALEAWPAPVLSEHRDYLTACAEREPHEEVQARLWALLAVD